MKIYISVDIEGITGVTNWSETEKDKEDYKIFAVQMNREVPLAHSMNPYDVKDIKINGEYASEFLIHAYAAATVGVPVVFVSGDRGVTEEVKDVNKNITTLSVKEGIGASTINIHPGEAIKMTKEMVERSLKGNLDMCKLNLPKKFVVEVEYTNHMKAYRCSFYPRVVQVSPYLLRFESTDYFEVLRMILFLT